MAATDGPPVAPVADPTERIAHKPPTFVFFGVVSAVALLADVVSKAWAEVELTRRIAEPPIQLIKDHLALTLAYNKGGAWGLLQEQSESLRRPFFLIVSLLAIAFIVSLYNRLLPGQRALKWGLPLVLGGALGNLADRIVRSSVIDFIDYRADWIRSMNGWIQKWHSTWTVTDHWPTFNVADIAICIGVALMGVDMVTSRRKPEPTAGAPAPSALALAGDGPVDGSGPTESTAAVDGTAASPLSGPPLSDPASAATLDSPAPSAPAGPDGPEEGGLEPELASPGPKPPEQG